jgi:hypothetical protein
MNTQIRHVVITGSAIAALVACGIATEASPAFKQHAITVGIALLAMISLSGLFAGPILRILDTPSDTTRATKGSERPSGTRTGMSGTAHTGSLR